MRKFSFVFVLLVLVISCKNAPTTAVVETQNVAVSFENIQYSDSIQNIQCAENSGYSYSLFLPTVYKSGIKLPIIFAFDPHAEGKLPIEKYRKIAEKYGFILATSNDSKNGMSVDETNIIAGTIVNDCQKRLAVDPNRMICMGFSGGARVAASYSMLNLSVSSLVICGAGFQPDASLSQRNMSIFMLAGNTDFNLLELQSLNQMLETTNVKHDFFTFSGKHEWPSEDKMEKVFQRYEVLKMIDKTMVPDQKKIEVVKQSLNQEIAQSKTKNNSIEMITALRKKIQYISSFENTQQESDEITKLQSNAKFKVDQDKLSQKIDAERQLQQQYVTYFTSQNFDWWEKEVLRFAALAKKQNPSENDLIQLRLKAYLGLGIYMYANNALKTNDLEAAMHFIAIYGILEPENPEPFIMKAIIDLRGNKVEAAVASLMNAIHLGFKDEARLNSPDFAPLQNTPYQLQLLDEMRAGKK